MTDIARKRVTYLFGAGASHAAVKAVGSAYGILMNDLTSELAEVVRNSVYREPFAASQSLKHLANHVIDDRSDVEHIITFLDQSPSGLHRKFAEELRKSFETVLRKRLEAVYEEVGEKQCDLYAALLDMYDVPGFSETLNGFLTLNYDSLLESAVKRFSNRHVEYGIAIAEPSAGTRATPVIKLHGSFDWEQVWPIRQLTAGTSLCWIPPGIQKAKESYPFNLLWGRARELLACDVLRIVGCSLGPNDWDLVSLLFGTRHVVETGEPYEIHVIDSPARAKELKQQFPYLDIRSILEVEPVGSQLVAEFGGGEPRRFDTLDSEEQDKLVHAATGKNWLLVWVSLMAETTYRDLGSVATPLGALQHILDAYA